MHNEAGDENLLGGYNPEDSENEAGEEFSSRIVLHIDRHGAKGPKPEDGNDYHTRLSSEGYEQARGAHSPDTNLNQSVAYGSPRDRAQETAGLKMSGSEAGSLEELREDLDGELAYGSKLGQDIRLDFQLNPKSEFGKVAYEAFGRGEFMKFLVEESDELAHELGDTENDTYATMAKNVGELVQRYVNASGRWDRLVQDPEKDYDDNTLERFLGTHQSVGESFLAKVIELTDGVEARDKFVEAVDQQGFGFVEGFTVEIGNKGDGSEPVVHVSYKKAKDGETVFEFDRDIDRSVLDEITKPETGTDTQAA